MNIAYFYNRLTQVVMKYIFIIPLLLLMLSSCTQKMNEQIMDLSYKVDSLSAKVDKLAEKNNTLEIEVLMLESKQADSGNVKKAKMDTPLPVSKPLSSTVSKPKVEVPEILANETQCIAITSSGKRCSRTAVEGSKYCYQHKQIFEPEIPK